MDLTEDSETEEKDHAMMELGDTVRSFLGSLMCLSTCDYITKFEIDVRSKDFFYHTVKINFSISPLYNPTSRTFYQCDSVSYLIGGLQDLFHFPLLAPCYNYDDPEILFKAKLAKYAKMFNTLPANKMLTDYERKMEWQFEEDLMQCIDPLSKDWISLPKDCG